MSREQAGVLYCLGSAAGFGAMGIFAKFAYASDMSVLTLLSVRFGLAALVFWGIVAMSAFALPRRATVVMALFIGLVLYSAQSELLFSGLKHLDASLASLLAYVYPAMVTIAAVLVGRERLALRRVCALLLATLGVFLVLWGGSPGAQISLFGVILVISSSVVYTIYILVSDAAMRDIEPLLLATLVSTGAATYFITRGLIEGQLGFNFGIGGWWPLVALSLLSTVMAITFFFQGISRVGPTAASIISTVEPPTTLILAFLLLGERLTVLQGLGGMLVLSAVITLQVRGRAVSAEPPPDAVIGRA